mmetsp:Transcript_6758/g.16790  ORF Transcript_6758/g.16790 Transcript_6758/m.16790 type:complete len:243 (+) Transcript_6758:74-802(+)
MARLWWFPMLVAACRWERSLSVAHVLDEVASGPSCAVGACTHDAFLADDLDYVGVSLLQHRERRRGGPQLYGANVAVGETIGVGTGDMARRALADSELSAATSQRVAAAAQERALRDQLDLLESRAAARAVRGLHTFGGMSSSLDRADEAKLRKELEVVHQKRRAADMHEALLLQASIHDGVALGAMEREFKAQEAAARAKVHAMTEVDRRKDTAIFVDSAPGLRLANESAHVVQRSGQPLE